MNKQSRTQPIQLPEGFGRSHIYSSCDFLHLQRFLLEFTQYVKPALACKFKKQFLYSFIFQVLINRC